ncbi:MAG: hypothetical protein Q8P49_00685 [Candidatus Liptonbacteria bacterium]|nr:hypothetical protein [Candidatus Liptonbacteria bacterium]
MEYADFLRTMAAIYGEIETMADDVARNGIAKDPNLDNKMGGYFVVLEHGPEFAKRAEKISRSIADIVPASIYRACNIHTTLGSFRYVPNTSINPDNPVYGKILEDLSRAVFRAICRFGPREIYIDYPGYLYTPHVVLAEGVPDERFVSLMDRVVSACGDIGIDLQPGWGAHVTLARFTGAAQPEKIGDFRKLIANTDPLGKGVSVAVKIGYALWEPNSAHQDLALEEARGHFATYRRIPFF